MLVTMVGTEAELNTALAGVDPDIVFTNDINLTAPVIVARDVTIDGAGFSLTSGGSHRVIDVTDGDGISDSITVNIDNMTITGGGGVGIGAGIRSEEILNLTGVTVTGNVAEQPDVNFVAVGGGIATLGTLALDGSTVSGNTATTPAGYANDAYGGGIAAEGSDSSISLVNGSQVANNVAKTSGGGMSVREGSLTIDGSTVTGNSAGVGINPDVGVNGGGIYVSGAGPDGYGGTSFTPVSVVISNAEISGNSVQADSLTAGTFPHGGGIAISATGVVDVDNSTITGNTISGTGAMLYSRGGGMSIVAQNGDGGMLYLTVENTTVDANQSRDAGGVYTRAAAWPLEGVWNDSSISGNVAMGGVAGGLFNWATGLGLPGGSLMTLNNCSVSGNQSTGASGGIWNLSDGAVVMNGGTIDGNESADRGGGFGTTGFGATAVAQLNGVTVSNNVAPFMGGVYAALNGHLTINDSMITGNSSSGFGGGVNQAFSGFVYVNDSTISINYAASAGGGLMSLGSGGTYGEVVEIHNSTISGNSSAARGGGLYSVGSPTAGAVLPLLSVNNSTISNNYAPYGGGIYNYDNQLDVYQSTLSGNMGNDGAAVHHETTFSYVGTPLEGMLNLDRSTVSQNDSGNSAIAIGYYGRGTIADSLISGNVNGTSQDLYTYYTDAIGVSYSLLEQGGGGVANGVDGNIVGYAASLGALADNGGPTLTHALLTGSVGVDAATPGAGAGEADQRGATPRDFGGRMDMGAFEYGATLTEPCDFDNNGVCDIDDIDALTMESGAGTNNPIFDLTGDDLVNVDDVALWLELAGALNLPCGAAYLVGDANLDGIVDGLDFIQWNLAKFTTNTRWSTGNFNADAVTDGLDFIEWNMRKFTSSCPFVSFGLTPVDGTLTGDLRDVLDGVVDTGALGSPILPSHHAVGARPAAFSDEQVRNQAEVNWGHEDLDDATVIAATESTVTTARATGAVQLPPAKVHRQVSKLVAHAIEPLSADARRTSDRAERVSAIDQIFAMLP